MGIWQGIEDAGGHAVRTGLAALAPESVECPAGGEIVRAGVLDDGAKSRVEHACLTMAEGVFGHDRETPGCVERYPLNARDDIRPAYNIGDNIAESVARVIGDLRQR
jgi:hypothetical protein